MSRIGFSPKSRPIREFAERLGYQITIANGGHLKFIHPKGKSPVFTSSTPSDNRAYKNAMKLLQRNLSASH